jgi:ribonuclease E
LLFQERNFPQRPVVIWENWLHSSRLALENTMTMKMLIDAAHQEEMRVVITDEKSTIHEFDFTTVAKKQIKGNVYLAKVTRVEPSLQAAFVEYGGGKQGFLPFSEIHPDYYQIPVSDRQKLLEEEAQMSDDDDEEDEDDQEDHNSLPADAEPSESVSEDAPEDEEEEGESSKNSEDEDEEENEENDASDADDESEEDTSSSEDENGEKADKGKSDRKRGRYRRRNRRGGRSGRNRQSSSSEDEEQDVETLDSDDEEERPKRRAGYSRRYKIQEVIKRNQILLVQVTKEERGNKGVSMSTFLSLAGRYCVLMPNSPRGGGISRKISNRDDRKRLKKVISELTLPQGMSVIVRTAGAGRTRIEIKRDFEYMVKMWNQIREDTLKATAPAVVYEENDIIKRTIRDSYSSDIEAIWVEGESAYKEAKAFMRKLIPSHAPRVKQYKGNVPLFHEYGVEEQLLAIYDPTVRLKSGGYLVMNSTEALIAVDVNSGSANRERNVEQTAVKTNLEAAREVARQLRLRDLAGLIVIDFIDMMDGKNRRAVERTLKDALRHDRARIQVGRISSFGLLEMSRQRMRPSISESVNLICEECNGTGYVRSDATVAIQVIRELEKEAGHADINEFRVWLTPSVALHLLNSMRSDIEALEGELGLILHLQIDPALKAGNFRIEKIKRRGSGAGDNDQKKRSKRNNRQESKKAEEDSGKENESEESNQESEEKPKSRRRRGGRRKKDSENDNQDAVAEEAQEKSAKDEADDSMEQKKEKKTTRRGRKSTASKKAEEAEKVEEKPAKEKGTQEKPMQEKSAQEKSAQDNASTHTDSVNDNDAAKKADAPKPSAKAAEDDKPKEPARKGWWQKIIE